MRVSRAAMTMAILGSAMAMAAPTILVEPEIDHTPAPATIRTRHKPSGSQPVPGGGAKERAKRIARMEKAAAKAAAKANQS